jgi:D-glycero-D-manno-heptose 1,7-bisphosphate phosphatase
VGIGSLSSGRSAVFFDRDGVLNKAVVREGRPYPPSNASELVLDEDARESLTRLNRLFSLLFVVSNQPDVARGSVTRDRVEGLNAQLMERLPITAFYVCYHDDADQCECRKPLPGLLLKAASEYDVDLTRSYMVGDRWRDVEAGIAAGCTTILIDRGYDETLRAIPHATVNSLAEAAAYILNTEADRGAAAKGVA